MPSRQRWPPILCRGQTSDVLVSNILARSLQRLVTLSDYSLPGRFISDCICFSRQCPSIIRFPLTPCLQARRGAEIRIDASTELSDQITGLAAVAGFCPGHTCRTFFHTTRDAIAAHVDEGCTLQEKDLEVRPLCVFRLNQPLHAIVPATIRQPSTPPERSITTDTSDLQACDLPIFRLSVL